MRESLPYWVALWVLAAGLFHHIHFTNNHTTERIVIIPAERITEDHPAWDCETMGNMVCGPIAYKSYGR